MSILNLTKHAFQFNSRLKGDELWSRDRVRLKKAEESSADFTVRGTKLYSIRIQTAERSSLVQVECTCPFFERGNACKHIWASIREASKQELFSVAGEKRLTVELGCSPLKTEVRKTQLPLPKSWKEQITQAQKKSIAAKEIFNYGRTETAKVISFAIDLPNSQRENQIQLRFLVQEYLQSGALGVFKQTELAQDSVRLFPDALDRHLLHAVLGRTELNSGYSYYAHARGVPSVGIPADYAESVLSEISQAGKLFLQRRESYSFARNGKLIPTPYRFDSEKWRLKLSLRKDISNYVLSAQLTNGSQTRDLGGAILLIDRFIFFEDFMAASDLDHNANWFGLFRKNPRLEIPEKEIDAFLEMYMHDVNAPDLDLPQEIQFADRLESAPRVRLEFSNLGGYPLMKARLFFKYGERKVHIGDRPTYLYDIANRERLARNMEFENEVKQRFATFSSLDSGLPPDLDPDADGIFYDQSFLSAAEQALNLGWEVVVNQKRLHSGTNYDMNVSSGTDWFDVQADFNFQGMKISLPQLLPQLHEQFIQLGDGSYGLLPAAWLKRFGAMAELGRSTEGGLRLNKIQALFLTSDIPENEKFRADRKFNSLRGIVEHLSDLRPQQPPATFKGKLRSYQKEGLSWLQVITKNEIGGILADDMGLGKTVQILALIAGQKTKNPNLIVAPKSLVFNWMQEAQKFTPHLRVLNFTGPKRANSAAQFGDYDVILTTYQTLRSDIEMFQQVPFHGFILDEAHYAKNPKSQAAMACRLIQARCKFALTGTPVENSLTDLFSILDIVNPGLLSDSHAQSWAKEKDPEAFRGLARALKPFILRRTKENVLKDLPVKSEQAIYCELSTPERKRYDELRTYYWDQLSKKLDQKGFARSKIEVLEALLRLRQASCHQGLLDNQLSGHLSTKFELLLQQLEAVIQDGHKALVFSQFTSLLGLLKVHLANKGIGFEYLDGQTKDRQQRVENFQSNADVKVFLLSLKAGGVGLNLTAADYVFILDPWWNPAAESQAIDRTHRIGQKNKVFAYKIIAKDTIEEKILLLQESKKQLAKTLISDDSGLLRKLTVEDLRALFS